MKEFNEEKCHNHGCCGGRKGGHGRHGGRCGKRQEDFDKLSQDEKLVIMISKCGMKLNYNHRGHHGKGRILKVLVDKETITQSDLQEIVDVKAGSLSEILSKMEENNLIKREKDENDKRKTNVTITEEGKNHIKTKFQKHKNRAEDLFSVLNEEEKNKLEELLQKVMKSWEEPIKQEEEMNKE